MAAAADNVRAEIDALYRKESRRIFATLIRLLGDFERAEEALHDAFRAAVEKWPSEGLPQNPVSWLVSAGRFKSIDKQRRDKRFDHLEDRPDVAESLSDGSAALEDREELLEDDRLRLVFTCCHPALAPDAQVALTLREVCGLATEEIAAAFLTPAPTLAQRIVRAKGKIRDANIPYEVPGREELPARLDSVLRVIYLVFNEGYLASRGESATRADLSGEAIRLGRLVVELLPEPEARGLLALMLLHESRREARADAQGELVLLDDQDRTRWNHALIEEGSALVRAALTARPSPGPYALQAAIAAVHAEAPRPEDTDWREIVGLYDLLLAVTPSPIVALNRAVALAMRDGPEAGLVVLDQLLEGGELDGYQLAHAARADLCRRLGRHAEARKAYERAISLTAQGPAKRFLERRLAALPA
ncbi:MAG TPA: RNA polymerase sigma factor [Steroidobacteraceae bacterium]|jgi:RNA polymerase sigma-70 factor (ECF subfamily)|nr:RNA polymerase sigma factor [Steroidobacteraceae bacterium]